MGTRNSFLFRKIAIILMILTGLSEYLINYYFDVTAMSNESISNFWWLIFDLFYGISIGIFYLESQHTNQGFWYFDISRFLFLFLPLMLIDWFFIFSAKTSVLIIGADGIPNFRFSVFYYSVRIPENIAYFFTGYSTVYVFRKQEKNQQLKEWIINLFHMLIVVLLLLAAHNISNKLMHYALYHKFLNYHIYGVLVLGINLTFGMVLCAKGFLINNIKSVKISNFCKYYVILIIALFPMLIYCIYIDLGLSLVSVPWCYHFYYAFYNFLERSEFVYSFQILAGILIYYQIKNRREKVSPP